MTSLSTAAFVVPLWAVLTMAVLIGLLVGSFLNVVVYRVPRHLSVSKPRSFCPTCERQLTWWENVPVVSWVALRGRCHGCQQPISARYPLVEAGNAVAFGFIAWAWHGSWMTVSYCILSATVLAITLIDLGQLRAPLSVAALGAALGDLAFLAACGAAHNWSILIGAQTGLLVGCAGFALLRRLDPDCRRWEGIGRSALIPAGCWLGGLIVWPAVTGLAAAVLAVIASLALAWRWPEPAGRSQRGPLRDAMGIGFRRFVRRPILASVVVGMVVGLLAHA